MAVLTLGAHLRPVNDHSSSLPDVSTPIVRFRIDALLRASAARH
jgi:hypothetical protein